MGVARPSSSPARSSSAPGSAAGCRRRSSSPTSSVPGERAQPRRGRRHPGARRRRSGSSASSTRSCSHRPTCSSTRCRTPTPPRGRSTRVVMSLAAIPAYLIARRLLPTGAVAARGAARGRAPVARLHRHADVRERVLPGVPARCVDAPAGARRADAAAPAAVLLAACGVVTLVRVQGIAVVLAALTAPLLLCAGRPPAAAAVGCRCYGIVAGGAVLVLGAQLARGAPISSLFGAYQVVGEESYDVVDVLKYVVLAPRRARPLRRGDPVRRVPAARGAGSARWSPRVQSFVAATIALTVWTLLIVAAFASRFAGRDRRAEHVHARAAAPDRAARVDRPGRAEAACLRGRRGVRRGGSARV